MDLDFCLQHACEIQKILRFSDKSFVALALRHNRPVIIKRLLSDEAVWQKKFRHEVSIYRMFEQSPPVFRVPHLIFADDEVIITEHIEGQVLSEERYPDKSLPIETLYQVLDVVQSFSSVQAKERVNLKVWDYTAKIVRYHEAGFFSDTERDILSRLLDSCPEKLEFNHGDLLLSNMIVTSQGACVPIDWEFAGFFLPGFDLSLLGTILIEGIVAQEVIESVVREQNIEIPFFINQAIVIAREIHMHRKLPDEVSFKHKRLALLQAEWERVRLNLKTL